MTRLCNDGTNVIKSLPRDSYPYNPSPGELGQFLDLREFAPIFKLRSNETQLLHFEKDRLKMLCDDYVSILYLYSIILFVSCLLTIYSTFVIHIIFNGNLKKNITKRYFTELTYYNEMKLMNEQ